MNLRGIEGRGLKIPSRTGPVLYPQHCPFHFFPYHLFISVCTVQEMVQDWRLPSERLQSWVSGSEFAPSSVSGWATSIGSLLFSEQGSFIYPGNSRSLFLRLICTGFLLSAIPHHITLDGTTAFIWVLLVPGTEKSYGESLRLSPLWTCILGNA